MREAGAGLENITLESSKCCLRLLITEPRSEHKGASLGLSYFNLFPNSPDQEIRITDTVNKVARSTSRHGVVDKYDSLVRKRMLD